MTMREFVYGGKSFPFDIDEYEDAKRYNDALKALLSTQCPERSVDQGGFIKLYCSAIRAFFDTIFGDGAAVELIGESLNKRKYDTLYSSFLNFVNAQVNESNKRVQNAIQKYAPDGETE